MRQLLRLIAPAILLASSVGATTVLYEPTPTGVSSRTSFFSVNSQSGFLAFDNFTLNAGDTVTRATWRGFWLDQPDPAPAPNPNISNWQLGFYADNAGAPETLLDSNSFAADLVTQTFQGTGQFSLGSTFNVSIYEYSVDLTNPFSAGASGQYWFSVLGIGTTVTPYFILSGATGGDDASFQETLGAGMSVLGGGMVGRDRAIKLEGEHAPEPGTIALLGGGLLALSLWKRRRII